MHQPRLGKNTDGYHGDRIDVHRVLHDFEQSARRHGWGVERIPVDAQSSLLALHRTAAAPKRRIYISAGIHGDEPAGPLAVLRLLDDNLWPEDAAMWLCPCLNPAGLERNTRTNADGIDLNRDYREPQSAEVRAHIRWLEAQPLFDFALCLHEDWEAHGFYAYEINPDARDSLAARMVRAVSAECPIDTSPQIDGWPAQDGVITPAIDPATRPLWPEAIYLFKHHTRQTSTLEVPSDFPLAVRVRALVAGVRAALDRFPPER